MLLLHMLIIMQPLSQFYIFRKLMLMQLHQRKTVKVMIRVKLQRSHNYILQQRILNSGELPSSNSIFLGQVSQMCNFIDQINLS